MKQLGAKLGKAPLLEEERQTKALGVYPYFRPISSDQDAEVTINGKKVLMFGSNSYLGLTNHPKVKQAGMEAIKKYGTGCAGSPFLNGYMDIHVELEEKLAKFVGKEQAIVYSTGFQSNLGALSCVVGRGDYIICDERDHASIVDGRRLSFATQLKFKHNDMESLEEVLMKLPYDSIKLIVVDGVFSMEGDIAPLTQIVELAEKYNGSIYVDEAHSLGVLGNQGRGVCNHFGVTDKVDIIIGTFSKSLATIGGFVAADATVMDYLRHHSRPYIFSASISPAATASVLAALDVMQQEPERLQNLWDMTNYSLKLFRDFGFEIGPTQTPIIPLYIHDMRKTFTVTRDLLDEGIFVSPVIPPACAPEDTLIRFALMATHTKQQIDHAVDVIVKIFRKYDIIR
ncbi:MAG: pyridoxal phosphate-dependent aminotransferase family protein [Bacteroidales bacterium]|nr:pyridoxal phosphate-dependent aminotransferase family protein [Bacteroidales bacterium]MBP3254798.1 pyridoxal phosphate-dependent aminotransferase family protein [Bacteroidales bacterium]